MRAHSVLPVLGLMLLWTPQCPAKSTGRVKVKVLILGAGAAGVTAASHLHKKGVEDFLVLEGQDYVGGRIKNADFMGQKVETGANWIHVWVDKNPLYHIREKYKLKGTPSNMSNLVIRNSTGDDITDWNTLKRYYAASKKLTKLQDYYYEEELPDISLKKALQKVGWDAKTQVERAVERFDVDFEYTVDSDAASFYGWGLSVDADYFVVDPRGYSVFLLDMIKPFEDKVLLNKTVNSIQSTKDSVLVDTTDGSLYEADYVVCTFSNNVLLSNMVKFQPPLPSDKMSALRRLPTGYYTKIFLKFPRKFWDDKEYILYASGKGGGYYHHFQDLSRPGMFPNVTALLLVTCTSNASLRVEAQSTNDTLKEIMTILRGVYGQGIPDAEGIFYARWSRNPYTRGSYATALVGANEEVFKNLASHVGRVFFAGDGTTEVYGTVHGAMGTGQRASKSILACINQQPECKLEKSAASSQHRLYRCLLIVVFFSLVDIFF